MSRRERLKLRPTYEAAVVPPIATVPAVPLSSEIETLVAEASSEIARFDVEVGAEVVPFASILLRSESVASSKIENLSATAKAIALAEMGDRSRPNANIIVANARAMEAAVALADRLDGTAIIAMHDALLGDTWPELCGHWRQDQVWIGGSDYGPFGAQYVAPHAERVPGAIEDLVDFMRRNDIPVLTQAAIAHAQFETIHPFPDGNGRVGRALIHSVLRAKQLVRLVTVPVSAGLLAERDRYFATLSAYREGDPEPLVEHLAEASFAAVANGRRLVADLREIRASWQGAVKARRDAAVWRLADFLVHQPVVDSAMVQRELAVSAPTANAAIDALEGVGVLTKVHGDHRYRKWAAGDVLAALDAFAGRAAVRGRP